MTKSKNTIPSLASKPDMWQDPAEAFKAAGGQTEDTLKHQDRALRMFEDAAVEEEHVGDWAASAAPLMVDPPECTCDPLVEAVEMTTDRCWTEAENLGWHKSLDELKARLHRGEATEQEYLGWIQAKMLLVVGEICEAQEELRNGRDVKEVYYSYENPDGSVETFDHQVFIEGVPQYKPEGWLVEMADARIRLDDLVGAIAGCEGVLFGPIVAAKLQYNATRGVMHGGKKF